MMSLTYFGARTILEVILAKDPRNDLNKLAELNGMSLDELQAKLIKRCFLLKNITPATAQMLLQELPAMDNEHITFIEKFNQCTWVEFSEELHKKIHLKAITPQKMPLFLEAWRVKTLELMGNIVDASSCCKQLERSGYQLEYLAYNLVRQEWIKEI